MKRSIRGLLFFLSVVFLFTNCRKKAFEEFYTAPNLAPPIYQQLQNRGNFSSLLKVIDKSGYKETLSAAGSWTFFAADDAAFQKFIQEEGPSWEIASVDNITPQLAEKIVRYSMAYDGEKSDRLSDFFSNKGFVENQAFRRKTLYYDFVYDGKNKSNQNIKVIDYNRNAPFAYAPNDFNNKNIPIFLDAFMNPRNLGSADYSAFYPASTYSGFNVGPASVSLELRDLIAENGVIHVIDRVLLPPPSIDQYISSTQKYSSFNNLLNKFVTYNINPDITHKYNVLTGSSENVYVKMYSNSVAFSPNNENHFRIDANDAQQNSYSIIAPTNDAVTEYSKNVLLKYFPAGTSLDDLAILRSDIVQAFINAHVFTSALWPSRFNNTFNFLSENVKLNYSADVEEKRALSNGFFYGVKKAQDANIFSTVYGKIFLDPKFTMMKAALDRYGFTTKLQDPSFKCILLPISNSLLTQLGFSYEPSGFPANPIRYNGGADDVRLKRIVGTHIIDLNNRAETPNFQNNEQGFLLTATNEPDNYEYIRYEGSRFSSSGTIDSTYSFVTLPNGKSPSIPIDSLSTGTNGSVVYLGAALVYTANPVGVSIERNGLFPSQPYYQFFQYLKSSSLFNPLTRAISGVEEGIHYTFFIPTNEQIAQAIRDGVLPGTVTATQVVIPSYAPTTDNDKLKVERFIKYHILNKVTIAADGNPLRRGLRETMLKSATDDPLLVNITTNTTNALSIRDNFNRPANVIDPRKSLLANRTVIHLIDSYLKYSF